MATSTTSSNPDPRPKNYIGSTLLFIGIFTSATVYGLILLTVGLLLPYKVRWYIARNWCRVIMWMTRVFCDLAFTVEGLDVIQNHHPVIIFSNHQSAWETVALRSFLPPHSTVLKQELLYLPICGWALLTQKSIIINRKNQHAALKALLERGARYLNEGLSILVFPEGTRSAAGTVNKFNAGGAMLANKTGYPIVPIVHNAGDFWPRYSFFKYPGIIKVKIGQPIVTQGRKASEINREVENWVRENLITLYN